VTLLEAVRKAKRVFIIGNGGSFANAAHMANDLIASGVAAFTLDGATLTAMANDYGYETVFERWLRVVGDKGDILIALSGSGKSPNILNGIKAAEEKGMDVWRVFGVARGEDMQTAEEMQVFIGHELMRGLKCG